MKHILALFLGVTVLLSCGQSNEEKQRIRRVQWRQLLREDSAALKVAVLPTLDCLPLFLAKERGLFDTLGVDVRLKRFKAQMDCDTALVGGSVEGMVTDLVRAEHIRLKGTPLRYVSATNAYWQLLTSRTARIRQLKQLDDKMIAMSRFSATDMLAARAIDSAGLKTERVFRIQVNDVKLRLDMMLTGAMDALLLPEPHATKARQAHSPVLLDSRKLGLDFGVVAFREKALKDNTRQKQLEAFLKAYNMACDSLNTNGVRHYGQVIARYCEVNQAVVDSLPEDLRFAHATAPEEKNVEAAKSWLQKSIKQP